jgi:hypothetical protein
MMQLEQELKKIYLDKYSLFVENYKPTAIPNNQTFVDQTGILHTSFSGLSPFFKQQYQTFATEILKKLLEAALQDSESVFYMTRYIEKFIYMNQVVE